MATTSPTSTSAPAMAKNASNRSQLRETLVSIAPLLGLIGLCVIFTLANPRFLSWANAVNILRQSAIPMILMVGLTFIIITGAIDLSIEGNMALTGIVTALLILNDRNSNDFGILALVAGVLVGGLVGLLNGLIQVRARIPSFMVTLGTWFFTLGLAVILYKGYTFPLRDENFLALYSGRTAGLANVTIIALLIVALGWVILRYTRFGRYLYAIGGNEDLAKMSGIRVDRYKLLAFLAAGLFIGIAGVLNIARLGQGTALVGSFLFPTVAAVVVGGTSISGGTGGVLNGVVGVLIVMVTQNGMILIGLHPFTQSIVQGIIFIVAVYFTLDRRKITVLK